MSTEEVKSQLLSLLQWARGGSLDKEAMIKYIEEIIADL